MDSSSINSAGKPHNIPVEEPQNPASEPAACSSSSPDGERIATDVAVPANEDGFTKVVSKRRREKRTPDAGLTIESSQASGKPQRKRQKRKPKANAQAQPSRSYASAAASSECFWVRISAASGELTEAQVEQVSSQIDSYFWEHDFRDLVSEIRSVRSKANSISFAVSSERSQQLFLHRLQSISWDNLPQLSVKESDPPPKLSRCVAHLSRARDGEAVCGRLREWYQELNPEGIRLLSARPDKDAKGQLLILGLSAEWLETFRKCNNFARLTPTAFIAIYPPRKAPPGAAKTAAASSAEAAT